MKFIKNKNWVGEITAILRSETKGTLESTAYDTIEFADAGVVGDKHFGFTIKSTGREMSLYPRGTLIRNNRQWSAISEEELADIAMKMGVKTVKPEWIGANLVIKGIPNFTKLPPLSMLTIRPDAPDKVVLMIYGENKPCKSSHDKIVEKLGFEPTVGFVPAAMGQRGLVGWIEKAGHVVVGDKFLVSIPQP